MKSKRPKCPHCGYEFDDEDTFYDMYSTGQVSLGDCDESDLRCPNDDCGETFRVRCVHTIEFIQIDDDGEEL